MKQEYYFKTYKFKVTHVVDGDTVKGEFLIPKWWSFSPAHVPDRIRFIGLNAPEMTGGDSDAAERAKLFVFSHIGDKTIRVTIAIRKHSGDWKRGDFSRVLGILYPPYSRVSLNERLLRQGHARLFMLDEWIPAKTVSVFKAAEAEAKRKRRGIWNVPQKKAAKKHTWWFFWLTILCLSAIFVFLLS